MNEYKLVFTGTTGAGKTTAINAISDVSTISTDVENNDMEFDKAKTTVGMDYGIVNLPNGDRLRLFGTPGQNRFDFMWRILVRDAFGLIILVDNSRPDPLKDLSAYLDGFREEVVNTPCVIGVGKSENNPSPTLEEYIDYLEQREILIPVIPIDVRNREEVIQAIDIVLAQLETDDTFQNQVASH